MRSWTYLDTRIFFHSNNILILIEESLTTNTEKCSRMSDQSEYQIEDPSKEYFRIDAEMDTEGF